MQYAIYYLVPDHLSFSKRRDNKSKRKLKQRVTMQRGQEEKYTENPFQIAFPPPPQWQWACPDSGSTC